MRRRSLNGKLFGCSIRELIVTNSLKAGSSVHVQRNKSYVYMYVLYNVVIYCQTLYALILCRQQEYSSQSVKNLPTKNVF